MEIFFDKGTIEFLTVATEFCAFVEKSQKFPKQDYLPKLHKMLSLIYLKASLLEPDDECTQLYEDGMVEAFISEYEYEYIKGVVSKRMGSHDSYINIYNSASNDSGYEQAEISECAADIYHNLKNFVENCRSGSEESAKASRAELIHDFREYWGYRAIALTAALHAIIYSGEPLDYDDKAADEEFRRFNEYASGDPHNPSFLDKFMQTKR